MDNTHTKPTTKLFSFYICLFLTLSTLSVYLQVVDFEFISMDDGQYISKTVLQGLTLENIIWSTTAKVSSNWHPLTMISHILDCQFYGLNSGLHHLTNIFFHIANTLLLFFVLKRLTGVLWQSAFVATLFALHPLHVESVAWVAERKDVLSTFFWMLTMWAYVRFVERPGVKRYLPVLAFFILGLIAKPMLVTLPFVLILLDYWPLKRIHFDRTSTFSITMQRGSLLRAVFEKIPLFALAATSCIVTINFQQDAISSNDMITLYERISNASVSYIHYIIKMIWPFNLACYYPHPGISPLWQVLGAITLLAFITYAALRSVQRHPFLTVGWFWYVGTLVPVIGLVQVGQQAMADRYTYIPLIGIFIIIAWGGATFFEKWQYKNSILTLLSMAIILILIPLTWIQIKYWQNSISLFEHALDVTDDNYIAHNNLALPLARQGKTDQAINHFNAVLKINPEYYMGYFNLGRLMLKLGRTNEAVKNLKKGLKIYPGDALAHFNLGRSLEKQGKTDEAIKHYSLALRINPNNPMPHKFSGDILRRQGNIDEAIFHYRMAVKLEPYFKEARTCLGEAHFVMGNILVGKGEFNEAIGHFQRSLQQNYNFAQAHSNLGYALLTQGKEDEAQKHCLEAIRIDPEKSINAYYNLACIYARINHIDESIDWLKKAIDKGFNDWNTLKTDKDLENIRNSAYYIEITTKNTPGTKVQR